jgi:HSP20 family protein
MAQNKKAESKSSKDSIVPAKAEIKPTRKTTSAARRRSQSQGDIEQAFDQIVDNFRNDFEDLLFPSLIEVPEVRVPAIDLENREKDFILKAEMPGFKKDEIEINVQEDGVEITGISGWKYDQKGDGYICKERACKSFYRFVDLPEEIKVDDVDANLSDGILEIMLPKKTPKPQKPKRKITLK